MDILSISIFLSVLFYCRFNLSDQGRPSRHLATGSVAMMES